MTPSVAIGFAAAGDARQLTIDEDCVLRAVAAAATAVVIAVVSLDPKTTIASAVTSPANVADENIIAISKSIEVNPNFPLFAGQSVFVSATGLCQVVLTFQLNR